jgi:5-methylcytosine-specific restriction enzyme subunit McrC
MNAKSRRIVISKNDCVTDFDPGDDLPNFHYIGKENYAGLDAFIKGNKLPLMVPVDIGTEEKGLCPDEYVGIIVLHDNTQIEIIPPIDRENDKDWNINDAKYKIIQMLDSMNDIPMKKINKKYYARENLNLFEICVRMFIEEVQNIIFNGLKQTYVRYQGNETFVKGKTIYSLHARKNFAHKERFYVEYDVYSTNRAENRLILSTMKLLEKLSSDTKNLKKLRTLINEFDGVPESVRFEIDFREVNLDRGMGKYLSAMTWCKLFLLNEGGTFFAGGKVKYAFLFPMNKIFSGYVASKLRRRINRYKYYFETNEKISNTLNNIHRRGDVSSTIYIVSLDYGEETAMRFMFDDIDNYFQPQKDNTLVIFPITDTINVNPNNIARNYYLMDLNHIDDSVRMLCETYFV